MIKTSVACTCCGSEFTSDSEQFRGFAVNEIARLGSEQITLNEIIKTLKTKKQIKRLPSVSIAETETIRVFELRLSDVSKRLVALKACV